MLPSVLGDLITHVVITDNGDGEGKNIEEPTDLNNWGTIGSNDLTLEFVVQQQCTGIYK